MRISKTKLWYILIFIFSINLFNLESRIILGIFLLLVIIDYKGKLPITRTSILLFAFSVCFYGLAALYNPSMATYYFIPFLIGPYMGYSIGVIVSKNSEMNIHSTVKGIIYSIVFGRFCHGALNFVASNGYTGILRNGTDFWTKSVIAATGQGALMTMAISLLFYTLFCVNKKQVIEKIILLFAVILSILNSMLSASRTALIVMLIVFFVCAIYTLITSDVKKKSKQKIIFGLLLVLLVFIVLFQKDILGLKTLWDSSPLVNRMNTLTDYEMGDENRSIMYKEAIDVGLHNAFGDGDLNRTSHNLWLDLFRQVGWIPFILLIVFTVKVIKNSVYIIKNNYSPNSMKYLIISVMLAMLINFSVEPIMKGMPYYFVAFCIVGGAMEQYKKELAIS